MGEKNSHTFRIEQEQLLMLLALKKRGSKKTTTVRHSASVRDNWMTKWQKKTDTDCNCCNIVEVEQYSSSASLGAIYTEYKQCNTFQGAQTMQFSHCTISQGCIVCPDLNRTFQCLFVYRQLPPTSPPRPSFTRTPKDKPRLAEDL